MARSRGTSATHPRIWKSRGGSATDSSTPEKAASPTAAAPRRRDCIKRGSFILRRRRVTLRSSVRGEADSTIVRLLNPLSGKHQRGQEAVRSGERRAGKGDLD